MRFDRQIRLFILLITSIVTGFLMTSCGGGAATVAGGGVGGTGISTGSITGFGSMEVNGVWFNTDSASFSRDGEPGLTQDDYSLGEVVTIVGTIDAGGTTGTANEVIFNDELEGPITVAPPQGQAEGQMEVLYQIVKYDAQTELHDEVNDDPNKLTSIDELAAGNVVEVSGYRDASNNILATSIKLSDDFHDNSEEIEVKGVISSDDNDGEFNIGTLVIDYSGIAPGELTHLGNHPWNGQYVEVKSTTQIAGGVMTASEIEIESGPVDIAEGDSVEVEGLITDFTTPASIFYVKGQAVQVNTQTAYVREGGGPADQGDLANDVLIEAEGTIEGGVLIADTIMFKQ